MPRGQANYRSRFIVKKPDLRYGSLIVQKLINQLMKDGKKSISTRIVYRAMEQALAKQDAEAAKAPEAKRQEKELELFLKAIETVSPRVEVKSKRIGGATYQAPVQLNDTRKLTLAIRLLVKHARKRNEKTMFSRLAGEMLDILAERGGAMKERENMHKMAKANQAFANLK